MSAADTPPMPTCHQCGELTLLPNLCIDCQRLGTVDHPSSSAVHSATGAPPAAARLPVAEASRAAGTHAARQWDSAPASTPTAIAPSPVRPVGYAGAYAPAYPSTPSAHPSAGSPFASVGRRVLAYLLDCVVSTILVLVVTFVLTGALAGSDAGAAAMLVGWLGVTALYWYLPAAISGKTLGKLALNIRVVRAEDPGRAPGYGYAAARCLTAGGLGMVPLGSLINLLVTSNDNPEHRAVHDRLARTRVVRADWSPSADGYAYPASEPVSGASIAVLILACSVSGLLVIAFLAAIAIPVFLRQRAKGVEAQMRSDANGAATALVRSHGTITFPLAIADGTAGAIGDTSFTPAPGDTVTISLSPDQRGNFCVRVDNESAPSPVYLSSATGTIGHDPCDYTSPMTITN